MSARTAEQIMSTVTVQTSDRSAAVAVSRPGRAVPSANADFAAGSYPLG